MAVREKTSAQILANSNHGYDNLGRATLRARDVAKAEIARGRIRRFR